jgi:hypothetical protein
MTSNWTTFTPGALAHGRLSPTPREKECKSHIERMESLLKENTEEAKIVAEWNAERGYVDPVFNDKLYSEQRVRFEKLKKEFEKDLEKERAKNN